MESGTYRYDLEMDTPLGKRHGNLELTVCGNALKGSLTMFTRTLPIQEGACTGNRLTFCGDMETFMKQYPYQAEGSICPSGVDLIISTEQGRYPVAGTLTEMQRR